MAQIIMTSKKDITEFPFADEVHDMGDFIGYIRNSQLGKSMLNQDCVGSLCFS